jgi:hypothetical protein
MYTVYGATLDAVVDLICEIDPVACLVGLVAAVTAIAWVPLLLCATQADNTTVAVTLPVLLVWYFVLVAKGKSWDQKKTMLDEAFGKLQEFVIPASSRILGYPLAICLAALSICFIPFAFLADVLSGGHRFPVK